MVIRSLYEDQLSYPRPHPLLRWNIIRIEHIESKRLYSYLYRNSIQCNRVHKYNCTGSTGYYRFRGHTVDWHIRQYLKVKERRFKLAQHLCFDQSILIDVMMVNNDDFLDVAGYHSDGITFQKLLMFAWVFNSQMSPVITISWSTR